MEYMIELTEAQYDRLQKCFELIGWQKQLTPLNQLGHFYSDEKLEQLKKEAYSNGLDAGYKAHQMELEHNNFQVGDRVCLTNELQEYFPEFQNGCILKLLPKDEAYVYFDGYPQSIKIHLESLEVVTDDN